MEAIIMYADGGCRNNQGESNIGGWGAYLQCGEYKKEVKGSARNTTNNVMELTGCIEGLRAIVDKSIPVEVHLDSAYVLNGITSWIEGWKANGWRTSKKKPVLNQEYWMALDREKSQFANIKFIKVKGHAGIEGNEIADRLCNEAMDEILKEKM